MIAAAVFDFDGVVLESADIKTRAFERLFDGDPRALAHHLDHVGVSRYEKFRHITTEILGRPYDDAEEQRLAGIFSDLVLDEVLQCPFVPGARELLERRSAEAPLFLASGTPQDELRQIVTARELEDLFAGVYGSPDTKDVIAGRVLEAAGIAPGDSLFVGDAITDLEGARAVGMPFVGRVPPGGPDVFDGTQVHVVADMAQLDREWEDLSADPPPVP